MKDSATGRFLKRVFIFATLSICMCILLTGCEKRCYICEKSGANYELAGYDLCYDCYMQVLESTKDEPSYSNDDNSFASTNSNASTGERNALTSAKQYLNSMAFSYSGLIEQLEYEGYTKSEATYAADNCGADWYEQAALSAKEYLDVMPFSRQGLIEQLEYEGFTYDQAVYGVEQNGY